MKIQPHIATHFATIVLAGLAASTPALAAPSLRESIDLKGDFLMFGNTVGWDCGIGGVPAPLVGSVGACGDAALLSDTAPDIFWRSDSPSDGTAEANASIAAATARSTAVLDLPSDATVVYARLYWAAMKVGNTPDASVVVDRPGAFSMAVDADDSWALPEIMGMSGRYVYQASADVTSLLQTNGEGAYRISGIDSVELPALLGQPFIGWSIVVFYERPGDPPRRLALLDGFDQVSAGATASATLTGFTVPMAGFDAKLGVITYEGDVLLSGDSLIFNGATLADAQNPADNFFNSTRSNLGTAVSVAGDLPRLDGTQGTLMGMDLDVVDVTSQVAGGDTSADISATSTGDAYFLGAFVVAISTFKPDLSNTVKEWTSTPAHPGGAVLPGDEIEYTITTTNKGNDPAANVILEDTLPVGVTFVPGSIRIATGPGMGTYTDAAGDDRAEYVGASRLVRVRLGTGASASLGGTLAVDASTSVKFKVTVDANATGPLQNQAIVRAKGQSGAPEVAYPSDGNGPGPGAPPTSTPLDECAEDTDCKTPAKPFCLTSTDPNVCVECRTSPDCKVAPKLNCDATTHACRGCVSDTECGGTTPKCHMASGACVPCLTDDDCTGPLPICNTSSHMCGPCTSDADCKNPARPACQGPGPLEGSCTECSGSNMTRCLFPKPICLTAWGLCGCTDTDGDSECGGGMSGIVCNGPAGVCTAGCSKAPARNDCPSSQTCSKTDGSVGTCGQGCMTDMMCMAPTPRCDTSVMPGACVACLEDKDCPTAYVCADTTSKTCVECTPTKTAACTADKNGKVCLTNSTCGCTTDADCGGLFSGRVCDTAVQKCRTGCRGTGGNQCPMPLLCTSKDNAIGNCTPTGEPPEMPVEPVAEVAPEAAAEPAAEAAPEPEPEPAPEIADAATDHGTDAGPQQDAAPGEGGYLAGGGCACRTPTSPSPGAGAPALACALAALIGRRRRSRR